MIYLLVAFGICAVGSWISYSPFRESHQAKWAMAALGAMIGWFWCIAIRHMPDRESVFVFSLYWDAVVMSAYYLLPLFFMGVKPNAGVVVGASVVLLGLFIVKLYS